MGKLAQQTIGKKLIIEVDADPTIGGLAAEIGSFAIANISGAGYSWLKTGSANTAWQPLSVGGAVDLTPYFKKDGSVAMTGSISFDTADLYSIGSTTMPVGTLWSNVIQIKEGGVSYGSIAKYASGLAINAIGTNQNIQLAPTGTGFIDCSSKKISNVADPSSAQDVVTLNYLNLYKMGLTPKQPVRAASLGSNIDLSTQLVNGFVLDGVTLVTGNRVLVKDQTLAKENGIYIVAASGAASRSEDMNSVSPIDEVNGAWVPVQEGSQHSLIFVQYGTVATLGTDAINFDKFSIASNAWNIATATSSLNAVSAASYFGTYSGDFDISFYRNNVLMMAFEAGTRIAIYRSSLEFKGAAATIQHATANLTISSGNTLSLNATTQESHNAPIIYKQQSDTVVGGTIYKFESTSAVVVADGDTSKAINYSSQGTNKIRKIRLEIFLKSTEGVSCAWDKFVHIDQSNALVLVQDTFTSQNTLGASVTVDVTFSAGVLSVTANNLSGMTGKTFKMSVEEVING